MDEALTGLAASDPDTEAVRRPMRIAIGEFLRTSDLWEDVPAPPVPDWQRLTEAGVMVDRSRRRPRPVPTYAVVFAALAAVLSTFFIEPRRERAEAEAAPPEGLRVDGAFEERLPLPTITARALSQEPRCRISRSRPPSSSPG